MSSSLAQNSLCLQWIWGLRVQAVFSSLPPNTAIYLPSLAVIKALVYWNHKTILLLLICSLRPPSTASKVTGHSSTTSLTGFSYSTTTASSLKECCCCVSRGIGICSVKHHTSESASLTSLSLGGSFWRIFWNVSAHPFYIFPPPNCFSSHSLSVAWSSVISSNYSYKIFLYTG